MSEENNATQEIRVLWFKAWEIARDVLGPRARRRAVLKAVARLMHHKKITDCGPWRSWPKEQGINLLPRPVRQRRLDRVFYGYRADRRNQKFNRTGATP